MKISTFDLENHEYFLGLAQMRGWHIWGFAYGPIDEIGEHGFILGVPWTVVMAACALATFYAWRITGRRRAKGAFPITADKSMKEL